MTVDLKPQSATTPEAVEPPRRRLRFFGTLSFAVIVLFVVVVALSVWLPWRREQIAIAEIERGGGNVEIRPGGPDWLRERVGDEYMKAFDRATHVSLNACPIDARMMKHLGQLIELRVLDLGDHNRDYLDISFVANMPDLEELSLAHSNFDERGLAHLANCQMLKELDLGNTNISNGGLAYLGALPNLQVLWLNDTDVTDSGLVHLEGLVGLQRLSLRHNLITDAGLKSLAKLTGLQNLLLGVAPASPEGVDELQTKLPACLIWYEATPLKIMDAS